MDKRIKAFVLITSVTSFMFPPHAFFKEQGRGFIQLKSDSIRVLLLLLYTHISECLILCLHIEQIISLFPIDDAAPNTLSM